MEVIRVNKIRKYLESLGLELKYDKYYIAKHIGGRSFYNDGTYEKITKTVNVR